MYQTITKYDFTEAFKRMGRGDQFSYAGLQSLFDHLEELEEEDGIGMELDVIALCCDYEEWDTALDTAIEYGFNPGEYSDKEEEDMLDDALEYLNDRTSVIHVGDGIIIQKW
jgi:hypothetical protein